MLKKSVLVVMSAVALTGASATAASAAPTHTHSGDPSTTTLDACGYFSGTQTPRTDKTVTNADGSTTTTEHGSWTGVNNDGTGGTVVTPVESLGSVKGEYTETTTTTADGSVTGTEDFVSSAGQIHQTFNIGPNVPGFFSVSVTATKSFSFLTSDTNAQCYTGPFPRA